MRVIIEKIEKAIIEKYAEIKQQGGILTGIEDLYRQMRFETPELAFHIRKRMLQIAEENGDLP